jgi:hypothetical protein
MTAPSPMQPAKQEPTFFTGTGFAVEDILLGLNVLTAKARNLKQANDTGSSVQQKLAAEEVSKIAGQIKAMADTISRVTITYLNRRARL